MSVGSRTVVYTVLYGAVLKALKRTPMDSDKLPGLAEQTLSLVHAMDVNASRHERTPELTAAFGIADSIASVHSYRPTVGFLRTLHHLVTYNMMKRYPNENVQQLYRSIERGNAVCSVEYAVRNLVGQSPNSLQYVRSFTNTVSRVEMLCRACAAVRHPDERAFYRQNKPALVAILFLGAISFTEIEQNCKRVSETTYGPKLMKGVLAASTAREIRRELKRTKKMTPTGTRR